MATGTQVPWTTPGETPCCCVTCEEQTLTTAWRQFELSATEYAALYAGGIFKREFSGSASLTYAATCSINGSGTLSETTDYAVSACSSTSSGTETSRTESITTGTTCGTALYEKSFGTSATLGLRIFDNGSSYQYGAQVSISSGQHNFAVAYEQPIGIISAIIFQNFSTTASSTLDNAFINFVILGRTIAVPYRIGTLQQVFNSGGSITEKTLSVSTHYFNFVPSAP